MNASQRHAAARPPVNLYTSTEFLEAVAGTYFPGQPWRIQDHGVAGEVFRLLTVAGQGPVLHQTFLDLHEPVGRIDTTRSDLPRLPRLPGVGLSPMPLDALQRQTGWETTVGAPTTVWRDFNHWDDYLALLRTRRVFAEDQRRNRRLQSLLGPLSYLADDPAADVLATCYTWKAARDLAAGRPSLFAVPENRHFFPELRRRGLLRASTLRGGGQLLAVWLGALYLGRWSGWVFAFNPAPALKSYSLGRQLLYPMLQESHQSGHAEFDFSIGMEPYKLHFATHVRPITTVGLAPATERAASTVKQWLRRSPWCYEKAKAVHHWLSPEKAP